MNTGNWDGERAQFARTGVGSPFGKLDCDIKTHLDEQTDQAFRRKCAEAHTDVAGALRNYVYKVVHGKTYEQISFEASQRRESLLLGEGLVEALNGTQR